MIQMCTSIHHSVMCVACIAQYCTMVSAPALSRKVPHCSHIDEPLYLEQDMLRLHLFQQKCHIFYHIIVKANQKAHTCNLPSSYCRSKVTRRHVSARSVVCRTCQQLWLCHFHWLWVYLCLGDKRHTKNNHFSDDMVGWYTQSGIIH